MPRTSDRCFRFDRHEAQEDRFRLKRDFLVMSWNILASCNLNGCLDTADYANCTEEMTNWAIRLEKIVKHLRDVNADVVCLQEVEQNVFENELCPALEEYVGLYEVRLKKKGGEVVRAIPSCATFFKKEVFEMAWRRDAYRGLLVGLRWKQNPEMILVCVNSHLEGAPWRFQDRANQAKSMLKKMNKEQFTHAVFCGDLNDGATSELCGKVLPDCMLRDSYQDSLARDFTCLIRLSKENAHRDVQRVDHIFHSHDLQVANLMNVLDSNWHRDRIIEACYPNLNWASDHFSIAVGFKFLKPEPEMEKETDEVQISPEQFFADNRDLLTAEEQTIWTDLEESRPTIAKKPTKEEIQLMRTQAAARKAFLESLSHEKQQFLLTFQKLKKQQAKLKSKTA